MKMPAERSSPNPRTSGTIYLLVDGLVHFPKVFEKSFKKGQSVGHFREKKMKEWRGGKNKSVSSKRLGTESYDLANNKKETDA